MEMIMGSIQREEWCAGVYLTKLIGDAEDIEDFVSMVALEIALKAINADNHIGQETAEALANKMAELAHHLLQHDGSETLKPTLRSRLQTIYDTHPGLSIND
jgi:hypothetical protein